MTILRQLLWPEHHLFQCLSHNRGSHLMTQLQGQEPCFQTSIMLAWDGPPWGWWLQEGTKESGAQKWHSRSHDCSCACSLLHLVRGTQRTLLWYRATWQWGCRQERRQPSLTYYVQKKGDVASHQTPPLPTSAPVCFSWTERKLNGVFPTLMPPSRTSYYKSCDVTFTSIVPKFVSKMITQYRQEWYIWVTRGIGSYPLTDRADCKQDECGGILGSLESWPLKVR